MDSKIRTIIASLRTQLDAEHTVENRTSSSFTPTQIIVCGMGGSGVVGDFLASLYPEKDIRSHKSFGLPSLREENTLYLFVSYSGETKETISALEEALAEGLPTAVVTGGGALLQKAKGANITHVCIPHDPGIPARFSLGYLLGAALDVLATYNFTEGAEKVFAPLADTLTLDQESGGEFLAQDLADASILVYTDLSLAALGVYWSQMLAESAKVPAFHYLLPEAAHNEIEAISAMEHPHLLVLHNLEADSRLSQHVEALRELAEVHHWGHTILPLDSGPQVRKLMNGVVLSWWTASKIAEAKNVDPLETPVIREEKDILS